MKTQILIAAMIAGVVVSPVVADESGRWGSERPSFADLDTDADGALSQEELRAPLIERFSEADTDGDGALSSEEMLAAAETERANRMQRRIERLIERNDANGDGVLQMEEMGPSEDRSPFARMDANDDGVIDAEEFEAAGDHMRDRRNGRGHGHGEGHGEGRGGWFWNRG